MASNDSISPFPEHAEVLSSLLAIGEGSEKVLEHYAKMGTDYDKLTKAINYAGHTKTREVVCSILKDNFNAKILDVGAGTGAVGIELKEAGYANLDAVEPVQHFVDICKDRKIYKNIICQYLGGDEKRTLPIDDDTYDMAVLAGVLAENHMPLNAFEEIIRVTRPGGFIINICREQVARIPWYKDEFDVYLKKLEREGKWKEIKRGTFPNYLENIQGMICIYQVL